MLSFCGQGFFSKLMMVFQIEAFDNYWRIFFFWILFKTSEIMTVKVEQLADSVSIDPARNTLNKFSYSKILSF